jgi:hypothetical protein
MLTFALSDVNTHLRNRCPPHLVFELPSLCPSGAKRICALAFVNEWRHTTGVVPPQLDFLALMSEGEGKLEIIRSNHETSVCSEQQSERLNVLGSPKSDVGRETGNNEQYD